MVEEVEEKLGSEERLDVGMEIELAAEQDNICTL